jgi:hypothetical protein
VLADLREKLLQGGCVRRLHLRTVAGGTDDLCAGGVEVTRAVCGGGVLGEQVQLRQGRRRDVWAQDLV